MEQLFAQLENISFLSWIRSDFIKKITETIATRISLIALGLVSSILVTRSLGVEGRGLFALAASIGALGVQFGNLGLQTSNTFTVARDKSKLNYLIGNSFFVGMVFGGVGAFVAYIIFRFFPNISPVTGSLLVLSLLWIPLGLTYMLLQNLLIGLQQIRPYNYIELASNIFTIILITVLVLLKKVSVLYVFSATLIGLITSIFVVLLILRKHLDEKISVSKQLFVDNIKYGIKAYIAAFFAFLVLRIDLFMVNSFTGPIQTGYYSVAAGLADMLYLLPTVVGTIIFPKLVAAGHKERKVMTIKASLGIGVVMTVLSLIGILAVGPAIKLVYGPDFVPAAPAFRVLAVAMIFYGINNIGSNYLASVGFPWFSVYIWAIMAAVNVILNFYFIPKLGIVGAAIDSLICYAGVAIFQYWYILKKYWRNNAG